MRPTIAIEVLKGLGAARAIGWLLDPEPPKRSERDPGAPRHALETLDDWILFGPRFR